MKKCIALLLAMVITLSVGGNGQVASFIDYKTNTYGVELKFRRAQGEDHFQFNVITKARATEWEEEGPELAYLLSFGPKTYLNSQNLMQIYFADYEKDDVVVSSKLDEIRKGIAKLPAVDQLTKEHKDAIAQILANVEELTEEETSQLAQEEVDWIVAAAVKLELFKLIESLGDLNGDGKKNANDALTVLKASVNKVQLTDDQKVLADVTGDDAVNAKDALEILQFAVNKRTEFSAEKILAQ